MFKRGDGQDSPHLHKELRGHQVEPIHGRGPLEKARGVPGGFLERRGPVAEEPPAGAEGARGNLKDHLEEAHAVVGVVAEVVRGEATVLRRGGGWKIRWG